MKKGIWMILAGVLLLAVGVSLAVWIAGGGFQTVFANLWKGEKQEMTLVKEEHFSQSIHSLELQWLSQSVTVYPSGDGSTRIRQLGPEGMKEKDLFTCQVENGTLRLKDNRTQVGLSFLWFLPHSEPSHLEVYLPEKEYERFVCHCTSSDFLLACDSLRAKEVLISSVSGDVSFSGSMEKGEFSSTSGDLKLGQLQAKSLHCSTISGELSLAQAQADTLVCSSTSGAVSGSGSCGQVTAETVSGDIRFTGTAQQFRGNTTSGRIFLGADAVPGAVTCGTVSGDVVLELPESSSFAVSLSTTSGSLHSDLPGRLEGTRLTVGEGGPEYTVGTVSGSCRVQPRSR